MGLGMPAFYIISVCFAIRYELFQGGNIYVDGDKGYVFGSGTNTGYMHRRSADGSIFMDMQNASGANYYVNLGNSGSHFAVTLAGGSDVFGVDSSGVVTANSYSFRSGSADPTTSDIPSGSCVVWKNTTTPSRKLWCNDGGTLYSVALN